VRALTELTHGVLPGMLDRGGRILNVASMAAFQPVAGMSVYAASKAFVLSFTEALAEDLRGTGVSSTALCPGITKTEMLDQLHVPELPGMGMVVADARQVAVEGYRACMAGEVICIPGWINQALASWTRYQPRWLLRAMSGSFARGMHAPARSRGQRSERS